VQTISHDVKNPFHCSLWGPEGILSILSTVRYGTSNMYVEILKWDSLLSNPEKERLGYYLSSPDISSRLWAYLAVASPFESSLVSQPFICSFVLADLQQLGYVLTDVIRLLCSVSNCPSPLRFYVFPSRFHTLVQRSGYLASTKEPMRSCFVFSSSLL
jgi:hypothetical protein